MATNLVNVALVNFEVYDSSSNRYMGIADIELPEMNFVTAELQGAGLLGKTDMPIIGSLESISLKINWRVLDISPIELLANKEHTLTIYGAMQDYDAGDGTISVKPVKIECNGLTKTSSLGKFETAAKTETTTEIALNYLKITVDDDVKLEFDRFNYIYTVGDYDYLEKTREALGFD